MTIPKTMRWRDAEWNPLTPKGTSRYELLNDMWSLWDFYRSDLRYIHVEEGRSLIERVAKHGVLQVAQIAKLAGKSRQYMHVYMTTHGIPMPQTQAARGYLHPEYITWLKEMIVCKFTLDQYVTTEEIVTATEAGSDSLVSILTGIPAGTLKSAREGKKV